MSLRRLSKEASLDERKGRTSNRNTKLEPRLPPYLLQDKQLQYLTTCPWPSVSTWKIFRKKKSWKVPQSKTWICHLRASIYIYFHSIYIELGIITNLSSVQSLSHWLFATPWTAAHQASLSITNSRSLLKLMSLKSVMPSNHLILCLPFSACLKSFPASESFPMSQFFTSGGQRIGVSASASVFPMNTQDWFPLGLTGLVSL